MESPLRNNESVGVVLGVENPVKTAWKVCGTPQPICSFVDVMSEQLAISLQENEPPPPPPLPPPLHHLESTSEVEEEAKCREGSEDANCENDLLLAEMLQAEFDKEHDEMLDREERKFNGTSKVTVSFKNYRKGPDRPLDESSDTDDDDDLGPPRHWDSFEDAEKSSPAIGKSGFSKQGNVITTKHDATICGRRNACRVMGFPPGFETGDGGGFDMKLPNNVFNKLKLHSLAEEKRHRRVHDKVEKATALQVLDPKTRLVLFKLVNAEILETVNGVVSAGKEAFVFHALGGKTEEWKVPAECAIKVYKTTLNEFKNRERYLDEEYRLGKQNPRKIIRMWAEKEKLNLNKLRKGGVPCPEVAVLKKNILVMSFIGRDQIPAPKLREASLTVEEMGDAYRQVVEAMKAMYSKCQLVHADLSEYNLLWHDGKVVVIDVGQAVDVTHPHALHFLLRDCGNVVTYFTKMGVEGVLQVEELFKDITELDVPSEGPDLLAQLQDFEKNQEILSHGVSSDKRYPFDAVFDVSKPIQNDP